MVTRPIHADVALDLACAVVTGSITPTLLVDQGFCIIAASATFCRAFDLDGVGAGKPVFALGGGDWDVPRLRSLLTAAFAGPTAIYSDELLLGAGSKSYQFALTARKLDYGDPEHGYLLLTVSDISDDLVTAKRRDDLLREKDVLLQEVQHRVANSLQIIASVLIQSARRAQSKDMREHLRDAHSRVMAVAAVQRHLAPAACDKVPLRTYFTELCQSLGTSMISDHKKLSIHIVADDSKVAASVSVSLGLIVTELVINALKHAFPDNRAGRIIVGYLADGPEWRLSVRDDGVGTPSSVVSAKSGLGSEIVQALAKRLDATVETRGVDPGIVTTVKHVAEIPSAR